MAMFFANNPVLADTQELIKVYVDGKLISLPPNQGAITINDRTLVPVRFIADSLGAHVTWDAATQMVTLKKFGRGVKFVVGKQDTEINGKTYYCDVPANIYNGHTYMPLRFVCEALGASVEWNNGVVTVNSTPSDNVVPTSAPKPVEPVEPQPVESVTADGFDPVLVAIQQKIPGAVLKKVYLGLHGGEEVQAVNFPAEHPLIYVTNRINNMDYIFTYNISIFSGAKSEESRALVKAVLEELSKKYAAEIYHEYENFILSEEKKHKPSYFGGQKVIFGKWADKNGNYNIAEISFFRQS